MHSTLSSSSSFFSSSQIMSIYGDHDIPKIMITVGPFHGAEKPHGNPFPKRDAIKAGMFRALIRIVVSAFLSAMAYIKLRKLVTLHLSIHTSPSPLSSSSSSSSLPHFSFSSSQMSIPKLMTTGPFRGAEKPGGKPFPKRGAIKAGIFRALIRALVSAFKFFKGGREEKNPL